jgi:hypothetical protein
MDLFIDVKDNGNESQFQDVIRLLSEDSIEEGGQYLKLSRLINNYIAFWVSKNNGKFYYHRVEFSLYNNKLIIESALDGSQSLNLSPNMLHRFVFRGIKEFLDYMIIASYDPSLDSYFFTFADGQNNLVNFSLPSLNNKIKFLRNSSVMNDKKLHDIPDFNFKGLNIIVDYKDREKNLDVFMLIWFDYGNTVLFIDHNLQTQKFNSHKFFSLAKFLPDLPLSIKIMRNKAILFSQDEKAYIIPQQVFFANYKTISSIASNFYVQFPQMPNNNIDLSVPQTAKNLEHLNGNIFVLVYPGKYLEMYRMIINDKKITSLSAIVNLKFLAACRNPDAVPVVVSTYFGCLVREGNDDMRLLFQDFTNQSKVLTATRAGFLKSTQPSQIQIKESLNKDYLIFASLYQVTVISYSELKSNLPVEVNSDKPQNFNEIFSNDRIVELFYSPHGKMFSNKELIDNLIIKDFSKVTKISLLPRIRLEYDLAPYIPLATSSITITPMTKLQKDNVDTPTAEALKEAIQIKRYKCDTIKAKVTIGHITSLIGVEIKLHDNINAYKLIASSQNINNFLMGSTDQNSLALKRGVIDKVEILNYFYIGNRVYLEYPTKIGYFEFESSNNFIEVKKHSSDYLLVQPLAFVSNVPFLLYFFNEKIEIYQGSQFISYANFPTRENNQNLPMLRGTYDEFNPNYFFFLIQPNFVHYAQMLFMTFVHVEVKSLALPPTEGQILSFKVFQNYLIFLNYSVNTFILYIMKMENDTIKELKFYTKNILGDQCRTPYYELMYNTDTHDSSTLTAKFVFCIKENQTLTEKLYYIGLTSNSCCMNIELFPELTQSTNTDRLFQISKIRTLNSHSIQEKLVIFESADRLTNEQAWIGKLAEPAKGNERMNKPSKDTKVKVSIYTVYDGHRLEINTYDYFDLFKNPIQFQLSCSMHMKNSVRNKFSFELINSCMSEKKQTLAIQPKPMDLKFDIGDNQGGITAQPLYIFSGDVFDYGLELSDSFENYFNLIKIEDIFRLQYTGSIADLTKQSSAKANVQIRGRFFYFYNPATRIYTKYNLDIRGVKSEPVNVATVAPDSDSHSFIYRNFYLSHGFVLVVYKNNAIQIRSETSAFSDKLNYNERIYEAKGNVQGDLITLFVKTTPFEINFSVVLLLKIIPSVDNKITIKVLNQQFEKITYQEIVVLNLPSNPPLIIYTTETMGLLFNFLPKDSQPSFSGNIIDSKYLPLYIFFKNEILVNNMKGQLDMTKIKCFAHNPPAQTNLSSTFVSCMFLFPEWNFVKFSFRIKHMMLNQLKVIAFNVIENFPFEMKKACTYRNAVISDKFMVTAFVVEQKLTLYVYSEALQGSMKDLDALATDLLEEALNDERKRADVCREDYKNFFLTPFRRFTIDIGSDTLDFIELNDEKLDIIANGQIYRYQLHSLINGYLKKHNLISSNIKFVGKKDESEVFFEQENKLHDKSQSGWLISVEGTEGDYAGVRHAILDWPSAVHVQTRPEDSGEQIKIPMRLIRLLSQLNLSHVCGITSWWDNHVS